MFEKEMREGRWNIINLGFQVISDHNGCLTDQPKRRG